MRTTLRWLLVATMSFAYAQEPLPLKTVEPNYDKYSPALNADFETVIAPVTLTVAANGKPVAFNSVPLPMAVVMALKDYEFPPQGAVPHGRPATEVTHDVTLNVPIRQSRSPFGLSEALPQDVAAAEIIVADRNGKPTARAVQAIRPPRGVSIGLVDRRVNPVYPEAAKHNRIQGKVTLEAFITRQGAVEISRVVNGPFVLVEPAYDAVKQWTYRPYLLKGQLVEMVTEIEIAFTLN